MKSLTTRPTAVQEVRRRCLRACLALATLWLLAATAQAHKASDGYLRLQWLPDGGFSGQWDIALRDLELAVGLDDNGDGAITWGELQARQTAVTDYALQRLQLRLDGRPCTLRATGLLTDQHGDGAYAVLPLRADCPASPTGTPAGGRSSAAPALQLDYRLLAEVDPQHRGLLRLQAGAVTRSAVLVPGELPPPWPLDEPSGWRQLLGFASQGVWHIWIGFDHILFLVSLLLPAVGHWQRRRSATGRRLWQAVGSLREAGLDVLRIVTAFTLAHSITLSLAALQWLTLPSRLVEATIAASVLLAALNNLWPLVGGRRWVAAFGFGLIHGFGFASVLTELGLPQGTLALSLLGFNLGVELGQLAIVAVFLPLAYALRRHALYRVGVYTFGSVAIALLAALWFIERAFGPG